MQAYFEGQAKLIPLMDDGEYKQAAELLLDKTFRGHINRIDGEIARMVKDWNQQSDQLAEEVSGSIASAVELMLAICVAVLLVMLVLAQLLKKQILRSVQLL